jgi:FolB domain-containing protein
MDTITIHDLHIRTIIGVHPFEKEAPQDLYLTIELGVDVTDAIVSDHVADTVDYDALTQTLTDWISTAPPFELLESFSGACVAHIFAFSARIQRVGVTVSKPAAVKQARTTSFHLVRHRPV